jgi:hypothetical protein
MDVCQGRMSLCIVVNKEVGRVYVDRWVWEEDVFDSRIEVDATDAIHFISSLRLRQVLTLMAIEFSGNIFPDLDLQSNTRARATNNLSHLSIPKSTQNANSASALLTAG